MDDLLREDCEGIVILSLNRPQKRNAMTIAMREALFAAVDELRDRDELRHARRAVADEVSARGVVGAVAVVDLVDQAERDDTIEQRREMWRGHAELVGELVRTGLPGVAEHVEHPELDRCQQHVIAGESLDRRPHGRRRRRLEVAVRAPGVRHRVRLLELRIRGVARLEDHHHDRSGP